MLKLFFAPAYLCTRLAHRLEEAGADYQIVRVDFRAEEQTQARIPGDQSQGARSGAGHASGAY